MDSNLEIRNSTVDFLIFTKQAGEDGINVHVEDETVWVTVEAIAKLFDRARTTITEHIHKIYSSGDLDKISTCRKFRQVQKAGDRLITRNPEYFNLDYASRQASKHIPMTMQDWAAKLDWPTANENARKLH